jgi:hypothetical protein
LKVMRDGRPVTVEVTSDGAGLVSHAGSALVAQVADKVGLTAALSLRLAAIKQRRRGHDPGRVIRDLAVMLADGGECVSDCGVSEFVIERPTFSTQRWAWSRGWLVGVRSELRGVVRAGFRRRPCRRATPSKAPLFPRGAWARSVLWRSLISCWLDSARSGERVHDASRRHERGGCRGRGRDARHPG